MGRMHWQHKSSQHYVPFKKVWIMWLAMEYEMLFSPRREKKQLMRVKENICQTSTVCYIIKDSWVLASLRVRSPCCGPLPPQVYSPHSGQSGPSRTWSISYPSENLHRVHQGDPKFFLWCPPTTFLPSCPTTRLFPNPTVATLASCLFL